MSLYNDIGIFYFCICKYVLYSGKLLQFSTLKIVSDNKFDLLGTFVNCLSNFQNNRKKKQKMDVTRLDTLLQNLLEIINTFWEHL